MTIQHSPFFPSPRFVVPPSSVEPREAAAAAHAVDTTRLEQLPVVEVTEPAARVLASRRLPTPKETTDESTTWRRAFSGFLGVAALVGFAATALHGAGLEGTRAFEGSSIRLPCPSVMVTAFAEGDPAAHGVSLPIEQGGLTALIPHDLPSPSVVRSYADAVDARGNQVPPISMVVSAISQTWSFVAFGSASLFLFALFGLFPLRGPAGGGVGALLSRSDGRWSVARAQLFVWILTLFGVLAASSLPLSVWPVFERTLLALLGISVLTAVGGGLLSARTPRAPTQLAGGWSLALQFARIQCLAVTCLGAFAVFVSFAAKMHVSPIPATGTLLVAASHAIYLVAKAAHRVAAR